MAPVLSGLVPVTAHFCGPLNVRLVGRGRWRTLTPLVYRSAVWADPITVPVDMVTDFASVPRAPFAFMLTGGRSPGAALVHDFLYQAPSWGDRELADAIFYEAMGVAQPELGFEPESDGIRALMWAGVRAGGWHAWNKTADRARALNPIWSSTAWPEAP